jgi:hypothetical protein
VLVCDPRSDREKGTSGENDEIHAAHMDTLAPQTIKDSKGAGFAQRGDALRAPAKKSNSTQFTATKTIDDDRKK